MGGGRGIRLTRSTTFTFSQVCPSAPSAAKRGPFREALSCGRRGGGKQLEPAGFRREPGDPSPRPRAAGEPQCRHRRGAGGATLVSGTPEPWRGRGCRKGHARGDDVEARWPHQVDNLVAVFFHCVHACYKCTRRALVHPTTMTYMSS